MTLMNKLVNYIQNREEELTTLVNEILTEIERLNSNLQNPYFTEENIRKYAKYFPAKIPNTIDVNTVISEKESPVQKELDANNLENEMDDESSGDNGYTKRRKLFSLNNPPSPTDTSSVMP